MSSASRLERLAAHLHAPPAAEAAVPAPPALEVRPLPREAARGCFPPDLPNPRTHATQRSPTAAASQPAVFGKVGSKNASDVVVVAAVRTAVTKAKKGAFKDTTPDELLKAVFEAVVKKAGVAPEKLGEVVVGNVQTIGSYVTPGRAAQIRAGIPAEVPFRTLNQQCASGLSAIALLAADIATGAVESGVASGVEHMSTGGNPGDPSSLPPMNLGAIFVGSGSRARRRARTKERS